MNEKLNVLWLAGWYPTEPNPHSGDFIQRHAIAYSLHCPLHVIHLHPMSGEANIHEFKVQNKGNLTEWVYYFNKKNRTVFQKIRYRISYLHTYKKILKNWIRLHGIPDIVHVHAPVKCGPAGIWLKKKYGAKLLFTEHWAIYNHTVKDNYFTRNFQFKKDLKALIRNCDLAVQVSHSIQLDMQACTGLKFPYVKIPNAVNTEIFYFQPQASRPVFRFIHVSSMETRKNPEGIIRTFAKLVEDYPDTELLMLGPVSKALKGMADTGGNRGKVMMKGEVPYERVGAEMASAHAFILYSWMENAPCVIMESLCCGVPVISTAVAGIPEFIVQGENGYLVEAGNEEGLLKAMQSIIEDTHMDRKKIAETATGQYSYSAVGAQFKQAYSKVLEICVD